MASLKRMIVSLGALLAFALPAAHADLATGTYSYTFTNDIPLWDISGTYNEVVGPVEVNYTINMDGAGKLLGQGDFTYDSGEGDTLSGNIGVSGTVKSASGVTRVTYTTKLVGDGYISGYYVTFTAQLKEKLEINRDGGVMIGSANGKMTVAVPELHKKGSAPIPLAENQVNLPPEADGNWNLSLNVATNGLKYTGTALVQLSNGRSIDLSLTGSYSAKTDLSKVSLKTLKTVPPGPSMNLNLVASFEEVEMAIQSLKGKVLGQSLRSD